MSNTLKYASLAVFVGAAGMAHADPAETKGGIKIKTEDGRFEANVGGRVHFDYSSVNIDKTAPAGGDGFYTRRAYLTLSGKLYGFKYKIEHDFAAGANKEMWLGTDLLGGFVRAGHFQPLAGLEELTSSNDILFIERPFISNNTIYSGREYQNGVAYQYSADNYTAGLMYYTPSPTQDGAAGSAPPKNGKSASANGLSTRVTFAPVRTDNSTVHLGISYDLADYNNTFAGGAKAVNANYAGRQGPQGLLVAQALTDNRQSTIDGELAASYGPAFLQAEYASAEFKPMTGASQTVDSYYVQASYFVTGETKKYKSEEGKFGNPKPNGAGGAWELKVRYDYAENKDAATKPKATTLSAGVNYYVNPNVRLMLDYNDGQFETTAGKDKPNSVVARAQLSF